MSKNQDILAKEDQSRNESARIKYFDLVVDSASGATITDADGKTYLDLLASASAINFGHCHPKVVQAIKDQAEKLILYTPAYFANTTTAALLDRLSQITPGDFPKKVALGNSGSDANEAVIKFARAYTKRPYVLTFTGAMHGSTFAAATASAISLNQVRKIGPLMPGFYKAPFPDSHARFEGESDHDFSVRKFKELEQIFESYVPADETAVILIEPIQGDGGIVKAPQEYMDMLYQFTRDHGIVFAVDEVNQGLGRSGKMWSIDHFGIVPDLVAIGKSIASGLPLSAVVGRAEIVDSLAAPGHLFTTGGNPVAAAAAMAGLDVLAEENLVERSKTMGDRVRDYFDSAQERFACLGDVRIYGLDGGIDIVGPDGQGDSQLASQIIFRLYELGVVMITLRGFILRFQPPLVITDEQLNQVFDAFDQVFAEADAGTLPDLPKDRAIGW
ncbi:4-aminobutyrate aminotransferase [Fructobacillus pseudoficulneus]|uniref:4-aminobutyrate aminotransferase n=1 Tax=Fructobacillus pseudoficulneus TaxID=220714 RepID=A0A3F3H7G4_9LACO|nr:aspartate aminotransferase family protein [Fructobacillus pseudoficulneus]GAP02413.1 4-aminobutyrate aminotransferase [Fructobacillus pseudoficulneus]SEH36752.1 4-aminobutyrate aminotransferase [Fructobacillus pseudoficulneus]